MEVVMKRLLFFLLSLICANIMYAQSNGDDFFVESLGLQFRVYSDSVVSVVRCSDDFHYDDDVIIPQTVQLKSTGKVFYVKRIETYAFHRVKIRSLYISQGIETIDDYAFPDAEIESITIPPSIREIDYDAFKGSKLSSVYISDLKSWCEILFFSVASNPLYYAEHLYLNGTEVNNILEIPESVTRIGGAFAGFVGLTDVVFPTTLREINSRAFYGCKNLQSVSFPDSLERIGYEAFAYCESLQSVSFPDSLKLIDSYAFEYEQLLE